MMGKSSVSYKAQEGCARLDTFGMKKKNSEEQKDITQ